MFQRHCVTRKLLHDNPHIPYLLFLDADMGVVNPNHTIEEYLYPNYDIIFYERIMNYEVAAGSYIVR